MREEKRLVKEFYESYGWRSNPQGIYNDTTAFVDVRPVLKEYQKKSMMRIAAALGQHGNLFLDAGCGALPSEQYVRLSENYHYRVCVDFSVAALKEARRKMGGNALCVQADITRLPFRREVFDAALCAHVLYHIPPDEQESAVHEIDGALAPGGRAVIVYTWPNCLMTKLATYLNPRVVVPRIPGARYIWRRFLRPGSFDAVSPPSPADDVPDLYFHPQDFRTLKRQFKGLRWKMRCWQSVSLPFSNAFVTDGQLGQRAIHFAQVAPTSCDFHRQAAGTVQRPSQRPAA